MNSGLRLPTRLVRSSTIPELRELDDDNKFDYNEYILSNIDY